MIRGLSLLSLLGGGLLFLAGFAPLDADSVAMVVTDRIWTRFLFVFIGYFAMREGPLSAIPERAIWNIPAGVALLAFEVITVMHETGERGWGMLLAILGVWLLAWRSVDIVITQSSAKGESSLTRLAVPVIFGVTVLFLWETLALYFHVPMVILPTPLAILSRLVTSLPTLAFDFLQTMQGILAGYVLGCVAGVLVAVLVDRFPFLKRGLLPLGNFVSALPIVGIAPIMVMWFGFDWQSKAAVVVVMVFFPQLVNTVAGLDAAGRMERDLMKTYAASETETLLALRLPAALPFIFNGLKINSTLALIGGIVAEFFGTPIVGMGFRINTEVGRMNIDMVWATIVVAAITGSLFYGLLAFIERRVTFWHASYRQGAA
jgi:NitT/TauT family transport system permease protein